MQIDWTDAFENSAYIPGAAAYPERWAAAAAAFRAGHPRAQIGLRYGAAERQIFDLFRPEGAPRGLFVFVHGGYWQMLDKSFWSHLAAGPLAHGYAVALPSYTLAPEARIAAMTGEIAQAIAAAGALIPGPIKIAGHSAGGHLVARMACAEGPLAAELAPRLARVTSISGLHDLRPLRFAAMNAVLGLDEAEAVAESAALQKPRAGLEVCFYVGAAERPEFLRQTRLAGERWAAQTPHVSEIYAPDQHHFSVLDSLATPQGALCQACLGKDPS